MSSCKLKSENCFFNQKVFSQSETNRENTVPCYGAGTESIRNIRNAFMLLLSSGKKK